MNRKEYLDMMKQMQSADFELVKKKNQDYATEDDAFANFRGFGFQGFVVRMNDKMRRLINFVKNDNRLAVKEESIFDTLSDLRNYCYLAEAFAKEETRALESRKIVSDANGTIIKACEETQRLIREGNNEST